METPDLKQCPFDVAAECDALYRCYHAALFRIAFRYVPRPIDAADVVQKAYLQLYPKLATKDWEVEPEDVDSEGVLKPDSPPRRRLRQWLMNAVIHLGSDECDKWDRSPGTDLADDDLDVPQAMPQPIDDRHLQLRREQVRRVLAALPTRHARILHMKYDGASFADMAGELDVPLNSIGPRLARAKAAFARLFREMGFAEEQLEPRTEEPLRGGQSANASFDRGDQGELQ